MKNTNIDYDKYLAEIGKIETNQMQVIKNYRDKQAEVDDFFRTLYRPELSENCYAFIKEVAKRKAKNNCACIEDAVVFKIARDFYVEILPRMDGVIPPVIATEKPVEEAAECAEEEPVKVEKKAEKKKSAKEKAAEDFLDKQLDLFAGL